MGVAVLTSACGVAEPPPANAPPPNLLLYVADTLRADGLGAYGGRRVSTPNLDQLAREGVLFRNAYAHSPWTRPSVTSLLTGLYPDVHGVETRDSVATEELRLLPELLADAGYTTAAVVANPNVGSFFGFAQGFDEFDELYDRRDAGLVLPVELSVTSDRVSKRVEAWLATAPEPFFLFVLTIDPHWPYEPPPAYQRYRGRYHGPLDQIGGVTREIDLGPLEQSRVRSFYDGEISFNDASFGAIVSQLRALGRYDRTAVVFTSDHGEEFWDHGGRFHAKTLYEEVLRVPLLLRYPPEVPAGLEVDAPVESVDVVPTLLRLAGVKGPTGLDGRDLLDRTRDGGATAYGAVAMGDSNLRSLLRPPWKVVWDVDSGERRMFNLEIDPREQVPLDPARSPVGPGLVAELEAKVRDHTERGARLRRSGDSADAFPTDLPDDTRKLLEHLGYLEEEAPDGHR